MNYKYLAVTASMTFLGLACGAPAGDGTGGAEAVSDSEQALTCPAGTISSCHYDQDVRRTVCECVPGGKQPWSGQSISVVEHRFQTPGYGTVSGRGWKAGDTLTVTVNSGCGPVERIETPVPVAGDGTFVIDTNFGWTFCHYFGTPAPAPGSFVVTSKLTTASASTPTWMYWVN